MPQVTREFQLDESQSFSVYRSAGYRNELSQKELGLTLQAIPIKLVRSARDFFRVHVTCLVCHVILLCMVLNRHEDMLYLSETSGRGLQQETTKDTVEDEIDQLLKKRDGLIHRDRDPQLY